MRKLKLLVISFIIISVIITCKSNKTSIQEPNENIPTNQETIESSSAKIASYNISCFGCDNTPSNNPELIVQVIKDFDIVSILEIRKIDGLINLVNKLNKVTGVEWAYHCGEKSLGYFDTDSYKEYYGFVYKKSKVTLLQSLGFYPKKAFSDFQRTPYGAYFKINNKNLILIPVHICYECMDDEDDTSYQEYARGLEISRLKEVYQYFQELKPNEKDIIILGDFNLNPSNGSFTNLLSINKVSNTIKQGQVTMVSGTNSYDNIFYNSNSIKLNKAGVYNFQPFKMTLYNTEYTITPGWISDHLPVYIEIDTTND